MIVSLLVTVEKSQPLMSRLVNVDDSMNLADLSHVIDAAFGFSGAASHLYMGPARRGGSREVLSATPTAGERAEAEVKISQIDEITYVYDPAANWNIHVEVLGRSHLDGPTPVLIDALGPDVVEACNGPAMMSRFHAEARRLTAGLDPDMEVAPLLLSFLPVMSPERLLQRLTQADQVTVSERISFIAEDMFVGGIAEAVEDSANAPHLAVDFEEYLASRPDLREILTMDPNPERNPTLIAAMAEFFEKALGTHDEYAANSHSVYEALASVLEEVWSQPRKRIKLTSTGALPTRSVGQVASKLGRMWVGERPRESSFPEIASIRRALTQAGLLEEDQGWLVITPAGEKMLTQPDNLSVLLPQIHRGFEAVLGEEWPRTIRWICARYFIEPFGEVVPMTPRDPHAALALLRALGVMSFEADGTDAMTPAGEEFMSALAHLVGPGDLEN
ncbi:IS1096 element passenger TnpR family protein [Corynebacterium mayonis]|uniref:IS1096 element passenger TnpR family protein n=1 Tax=Corynebacterium mayonis TaxID=3062461 RepID=UPI00314036E8